MATATMATAAGAAALLYYTLNRKLQLRVTSEDDEENDSSVPINPHSGIDRVSHRLIQAPATWLETISTLSETLRFTYSETLGKWPIGDLAFGINFLLKRQGQLHVGSVFGGKDSEELKGPEMVAELKYLLRLLTLCWHFSKKPFPIFLEETGYSNENVLLQEPKAGILKPAFTVLIDHDAKCLVLLIRGTHSIKDTLTAATGAVVPFHHSVVHEGGVTNLVLGYAHCGMVAAARWIAKLATPCIVEALDKNPTYKLKIVGHSLGGGTAALLTYILREKKELSTTTSVAFAPAACMTWDLAESGSEFITSVINGADLVPTFSAASVDDLRVEVTASAWINDLRNQIEQTRILSTVYRSASAIGSRLPSMAAAKAKVAGARAILRPVSSGTQVVMKRAHSMAQAAWRRPGLRMSSWSCMGPRQRATTSTTVETTEFSASSSRAAGWTSEIESSVSDEAAPFRDEGAEISDGEDPTEHDGHHEDRLTEVELWQQLEHELYEGTEGDEGDDVAKEIREEEEAAAAMAESQDGRPGNGSPDVKEAHRFFPAGKIMHIVVFPPNSDADSESEPGPPEEPRVGIFLTQRSLYSKLRLSQSMISDHLMPVHRRNIEKLIEQLEEEEGASAEGAVL